MKIKIKKGTNRVAINYFNINSMTNNKFYILLKKTKKNEKEFT